MVVKNKGKKSMTQINKQQNVNHNAMRWSQYPELQLVCIATPSKHLS